MILFSVNPAFDMLPSVENIIDTMFAEEFDNGLKGMDKDRAELYRVCEQNDVGITVMKGFAGGRLFDAKRSPFGVSLTPVQCIHYALTRPAVCSIMCGYDTKEQVEEAPMRRHPRKRKIMLPFLQMHRFIPTEGNVPTAATASHVPWIWTLP